MSSEPLPQGIYLLVKYYGSKSAMYFTNEFTETSSAMFRNDLSVMRFPHPKIVNTRLAPDATILAWWPDVSHRTHHVLCNNLKNSTNGASRSILSKLSISILVVQEMEAGGKNQIPLASAKLHNISLPPPQDFPPPAKRPRLEKGSHNVSQHPEVPQSHSRPPISVLQTTTGTTSTAHKRTWDGHPVPSGVLIPQVTQTTPRPPVPAPQTAAFIQATHGLPPRPSFGPPPPALNISTSLTQGTPGAHAASNAVGVPGTQPAAVQGAPSAQPSTVAQPAAGDTELEALRKRVRSMEEMLRLQMNVKVRLDETANKLEEEQQARKKLEETIAAARESEADAKRRLEEVDKLLAEEGWRRDEADGLVASARRDAMSYREMCDRATQERDEFARQYERAQDELAVLRHNQNCFEAELNRMGPKLEQRAQELKDEKDRRRRYQDRLGSAERREADLKQRCDAAAQEVASLTLARTIDANNARTAKQRDDETLRLREDKSRTQQLVIRQVEGAMHAAQSSEEALKRRLEEIENRLEEVESRLRAELEVERRLRQEAEDAIEDVRRECREPFVVPSLLDAFVELARLTTAATTPDGLVTGESNGKEKVNADDIPPIANRMNDPAKCDAAATGKCTNGVHTQCSDESGLLSPHYSPRSPHYTPVTLPFNPHTARLNASQPPDVHVDMRSPSSQIKAEPSSPTWR